MEYIGEVFDQREFRRRRKDYGKDGTAHFYFMALKADQFIDATRKGNISRFVNHSCEPNAETQKVSHRENINSLLANYPNNNSAIKLAT